MGLLLIAEVLVGLYGGMLLGAKAMKEHETLGGMLGWTAVLAVGLVFSQQIYDFNRMLLGS